MNGIHDLGGMHGLGPILNEENEPYFHHEWERRVFPLFASLFVGGHFNVDEFRHAIERMDPAHYLEASYYEHWLHAFETLLLEKGVITADELWGGSTPAPCAPGTPVLTQDIVAMVVSTGVPGASVTILLPALRPETGFGQKTSTQPPTPACRVTCAGKSAVLRPIMACSSRRTPRRTVWANILSTSTASASPRWNCGARRARTTCTSICGTTIWRKHEHCDTA